MGFLAANFMKILIPIFFILIAIRVHGADTIYVKKVFINGWKTRVKTGYIIRLDDSTYQVNDRTVKLIMYKETNNKKYKRYAKQ